MTSSTFIDNQSISPQAQGGAISLTTFTYEFPGVYGSLTVTGSTFSGNVAEWTGSYSGSAAGGAIWTDPQVGVTISSSQFVDNEAELAILSSPNGGTVSGGAIDLNPGTYAFPTPPPSVTTITNSVFTGNVAIGTGAAGTEAEGGAINAGEYGDPGGGTITISGSTFIANQALGDSSNINSSDEIGGPAQGGAINSYLNALALTSDTFSANRAVGGSGGTVQTVFGGTVQYALGGAVNNQLYSYYTPFPTLTTTIVDSLFTANQAIGGTGVPSYSNYVEGGGAGTHRHPCFGDQHLVH